MDLTTGLTLYKVNQIQPIFDFDYPIFDEQYRPTLEQNIFDRFAYREISIDDVYQWKHFFRQRMKVIMPYYNQLYRSALTDINPFLTEYITTSVRRKHTENQAKDYGSVLEQYEKTRRHNSGWAEEDVDFVSHQDDTNTTVTGETEVMHDEKEGTLDKITDYTRRDVEDTQGTSDSDTNRKLDTTGKETSTRQTDGKSHRETVNDTETAGTRNTQHSDYPQGNINATPPYNAGWLTWSENEQTTGTSHSDTKEDVTTEETQSFNKDTTGHESEDTVNHTDTTQDHTLNRTDKETVHQDTKDIEDRKTTDNINRQYDGEIDFNSQQGTERKTTDLTNSRHEADSKLRTAEALANTKDQLDDELRSGFMGVSQSELVIRWRESFINVDEMILNDLKTLFMGVY